MIYCFNPLFGGVWLLNNAKSRFVNWILVCFNPLFGGVWLLNGGASRPSSFFINVSTLYLLECGF